VYGTHIDLWDGLVEKRQLGRTDIEITPIGLGCMQFSGDGGLAAQVFTPLGQDTITEIVKTALDYGISWFDTAEMYGRGYSERALSTALKENSKTPGDVVIATKWAPLARRASNITRTIDTRLDCLQGYPIDLYQIHEPYTSLSRIGPQLRAMAKLLQAGKIRAIGVSNFSARALAIAHQTLAAEGIELASNQVRLNLLQRRNERNGVLDTARRLGITLIAYSPMAQGVLTGRFHQDPSQADRLRPMRRLGLRGLISPRQLARSAPLVAELRTIGQGYDATPAQVALNWLITYYSDTVVVIPGASKPYQAAEAAGAMAFRLTDAELRRLEELSRPIA
jgi:aryl-alcohol dehydrogenase-like predicted oxidoreductase